MQTRQTSSYLRPQQDSEQQNLYQQARMSNRHRAQKQSQQPSWTHSSVAQSI